MPPEDDKIEDSQPPPEIDRGLDLAFSGKQPTPRDPSSGPSILEQIGEITGKTPSVYLREVDQAGQAPVLQPLAANDDLAQGAGKYIVHGKLGEGGVGVVHKGHDKDLGRDVAIKFLHKRYTDDSSVLHRFVEEAQLGGQLQHPGIVPVYELGLADGRAFFAMKMVKGETLAKKLAERRSPADDRRKFLSIFEGVCQTMAYVHMRGVVHRDLKPANIMIGAFGEVQIVDWGMGKVLQSGGLADEELSEKRRSQRSVIETTRSSGHGTQSVLGSVMGTPAYMPPEQARGEINAMDERSDVFALGAMLCEILTGQPPYVGDRDELLKMASMAKLDDAHARLAACGAEPDLVELVTMCLMPAPAARPQSASAVAEMVHDHLAAAEQRVHDATIRAISMQRTQRLGITLIGVILVGLAASLWFWRDAETQRSLAEQSATEAKAAEETAIAAEAQEKSARDAASTSLANFRRLSNVVRLETAKATERALYPAWPEKIRAMRWWLSNTKQLRDALPELRGVLTRSTVHVLRRFVRLGLSGFFDVPQRQPTYQDASDVFLHNTLRQLATDIEDFEATEVAGVRQRLSWAEKVQQLTITRYQTRWDKARLAIIAADGVTASQLYRAMRHLELKPQMGLVPIGMNPVTKLWEFYHLRSAWDGTSDPAKIAIPEHRADGSIEVTDDLGIVFVLLPGGPVTLGNQDDDSTAPYFEAARAEGFDTPLADSTLQPFFLARHELTQGQWARLWDGDESLRQPSLYTPGQRPSGHIISLANPVEQVDWTVSSELLERQGLVLPLAAQWEYGCRAGTTTPWWPGSKASDLAGKANVLDQTAARRVADWGKPDPFDDGHILHSPVGTFAANAFGMYDIHGNVWEWCLGHLYRGGCFSTPAANARSSYKRRAQPTTRGSTQGLRAARTVRFLD